MNSKNKNRSGFSEVKKASSLSALLNTEHICLITNMAVGGAGVSKISYLDKSVTVFIDSTVVNDEVKIRIIQSEKNYLIGEIIEIIKPSSYRVEPPCPYYSDCGGCVWQHIDYPQQVLLKENLLKDLFKKFLPDWPLNLSQSVFSEKPYNYRNRIQLKYFDNKLGYFKRRTNDIIAIDTCLIADDLINSSFELVKKSLKTKDVLQKIELKINTDGHFEHYPIGQSGEGLSFSQVNQNINLKLVEKTVALIQSKEPKNLTELYSGSGNFTLPIAKKLPSLTIEAVEYNSELTSFLKSASLKQQTHKNLTVFTTKCETYVSRRTLSNDFLILDPPRSGCHPAVIEKIKSQAPQNIVYISCNPAALVRDLDLLLGSEKKYSLKDVQIFDMFPQTDHFETFVWLEKKV